MRDKLRQILVKGNVDAYTRTMTLSDSTPIKRTPLLMLKAHIQSQDAVFHRDYLPPGFPKSIDACLAVVEKIRKLMKSEKGLLRTLLLYNIKEMNHRPIDGAVPSLDGLVVVIDHNMASRKQLRAVDEIQQSYPDSVKTNLAFLRLYTVVHLIHRDPTQNISQWELIDQQIEYVKNQNHKLFGQKKNFDCIEHEDIRVPSEEDVEEEIRLMSSGDRSHGQSNPFD
ncbi:hypothetical protein PGT21_008409 [Puccinia graminis f. sp. tritici]|nr:hypothetical protein PGT21_008409 [Puccinia graminis f. sp. tritici]